MRYLFLIFLLALSSCVGTPHESDGQSESNASATTTDCNCPIVEETPPIQIPDVARYDPVDEVETGKPQAESKFKLLKVSAWEKIDGFNKDKLSAAWGALLQSCGRLKKKTEWRDACEAVMSLPAPSEKKARSTLRKHFLPWQAMTAKGTEYGLITGYYEPLLRGSRVKTKLYRYPLYSRPDNLITVNLASLYPELSSRRVRGRIENGKLVPYYSRGEIEIKPSPLTGNELLWVDDIIDLFFLQIQGSGMVLLENGEQVHIGYADQNGHPYRSIGRLLINRGELAASKASMQGIKKWARNNLDKLRELLNSNPSYVFFRKLPEGLSGPLGAMGVPLAAERSIAVDPRYIPMGAPVFLSTTYPNSKKRLQRLVLAQDTGGAIKGAVRADFFWGTGNSAGRLAGSMKQQGRMWVLLPKGYTP